MLAAATSAGLSFAVQPHLALPISAAAALRVSAPPEAMLFEEERSWQSARWLWGSPDGEAAEACKAMRMEFGSSHNPNMFHRKYFLEETVSCGDYDEVDWMDIKLALAMSCQKAMQEDADGADWAGFLEDMILCRFEGDDGAGTDVDQVRAAISTRLKAPPPPDLPIEQLLLLAFEDLDFVKRGL